MAQMRYKVEGAMKQAWQNMRQGRWQVQDLRDRVVETAQEIGDVLFDGAETSSTGSETSANEATTKNRSLSDVSSAVSVDTDYDNFIDGKVQEQIMILTLNSEVCFQSCIEFFSIFLNEIRGFPSNCDG